MVAAIELLTFPKRSKTTTAPTTSASFEFRRNMPWNNRPELVVYGLVDVQNHRIGRVEASAIHSVRYIYIGRPEILAEAERGLDAQERPCDFKLQDEWVIYAGEECLVNERRWIDKARDQTVYENGMDVVELVILSWMRLSKKQHREGKGRTRFVGELQIQPLRIVPDVVARISSESEKQENHRNVTYLVLMRCSNSASIPLHNERAEYVNRVADTFIVCNDSSDTKSLDSLELQPSSEPQEGRAGEVSTAPKRLLGVHWFIGDMRLGVVTQPGVKEAYQASSAHERAGKGYSRGMNLTRDQAAKICQLVGWVDIPSGIRGVRKNGGTSCSLLGCVQEQQMVVRGERAGRWTLLFQRAYDEQSRCHSQLASVFNGCLQAIQLGIRNGDEGLSKGKEGRVVVYSALMMEGTFCKVLSLTFSGSESYLEEDKQLLFRVETPHSRNRDERTLIELPKPPHWDDARKNEILQNVTLTWSLDQFNQSSGVKPDSSSSNRRERAHHPHAPQRTKMDRHKHTLVTSSQSVSVPSSLAPDGIYEVKGERVYPAPRELPSTRTGEDSTSITEVTIFQQRKFQKYRDANSSGGFYWIGTCSDGLIDTPAIPPDQAEARDLVLHRSKAGYQVWIRSGKGSLQWLRAGAGHTPLYDRFIAITEKGRLTLVKEEHWKREYKKDYDSGGSPIIEA
ncbi:hypothetical protein CONPUDRAFT_70495 [Coniophora puteana RWD-64-598 SS2]|uniref:Uncharacterized protein n=1 Tax=Coniophora puteana (strain RWD-64-598) TaxID=741705 RepID=A0A5M3N414_CONPW|nr:uncharacterized protein CONPUDRAFT_70495 [Coniophora puteana RWD-64-598 SS2]EIW85774.1 hypothetical protein CONPUDRAFT_70495 [Coniophora puteana RWD-64-598 SS2]